MMHAAMILTFMLSLVTGGFFDLEIPATGASIKTTGAKIDEGWNLWSNGYLGEWLRFDKTGTYTVTIKAKGQKAAEEWPLMDLLLDTKQVKRWSVENAEFAEYKTEVEIEAGARQLLVAFRNDYFKQGDDRNLHISWIKIVPPEGVKDPVVIPEPDWKEDADKRIEEIRKGELSIRVLDAEGKPLKGVRVNLRQTRHDFFFGTCINARLFGERGGEIGEKYREVLKNYFNSAVFENAFKWPQMEPVDGIPQYTDIDAALEWCTQNKMPVRGHCIFWANEKRVPEWAKNLDDDGFRKAVERRIKRDLARYRGKIPEYDVNNEMIAHDYFEKRLGGDIRAQMFKLARQADSGARLFVNDYNILNGAAIDTYEEQVEKLIKAGAPVGGIGCQGHFGEKLPSPLMMKMFLDRLAKFELPIVVTEFDINTKDEKAKAEQLVDFYRLMFSHPAVTGVLMWGFWQGSHWRPDAAIFNRDFTPRPSAEAYRKLVFDEWCSKGEGVTDENGIFKSRVFFGHYGVTITANDTTRGYETFILDNEKEKTFSIKLK